MVLIADTTFLSVLKLIKKNQCSGCPNLRMSLASNGLSGQPAQQPHQSSLKGCYQPLTRISYHRVVRRKGLAPGYKHVVTEIHVCRSSEAAWHVRLQNALRDIGDGISAKSANSSGSSFAPTVRAADRSKGVPEDPLEAWRRRRATLQAPHLSRPPADANTAHISPARDGFQQRLRALLAEQYPALGGTGGEDTSYLPTDASSTYGTASKHSNAI